MAALRPRADQPKPVVNDQSLKVFISYARADMAPADALVQALEHRGFCVKIDRRDLPYGEEWQEELSAFITESDTVLWLVSPDSVQSKWCKWELGEVRRLSKRLVPVCIREIDRGALPEALGRIHLLPAVGVYDPAQNEDVLVTTLNTDRAWLRKGTSLSEDAREWVGNDRDGARLLRGAALSDAENWSLQSPRDAPAPASEILELIVASRRVQRRRQRLTVSGSITAAVIAIALAATAAVFQQIAVKQKDSAVTNETIGLAALSRVAIAANSPVDAAKLALAAWPRIGDETRPTLHKVVDSLSNAFWALQQRLAITGPDSMNSIGVGARHHGCICG